MTTYNKHNFGAGPCILPEPVLYRAAEAVKYWEEAGLSILEISHRSPQFEMVIRSAQELVKELLQIPDGYSIIFLQGGASMQFCMIPMNFLQNSGKTACYLDGGYFGKKAIKEASLFGNVNVITFSESTAYDRLPVNYNIPKDAAYFHCTSNNTIEGTEMFDFPDTSVPVICDMSSDIFSREININKFDLVYAGAQKNMGPAGMTLVIIKDFLMDNVKHRVPSMLDYRVYRDNQSMYNTPPVFSIYTAMLNLQWLKDNGGVRAAGIRNRRKAALLYQEIDRNSIFYGLAAVKDRSLMNVTFKMHQPTLDAQFLKFLDERGMVGVKGYRAVGGFRASLYNALPYNSVMELVKCMRDFETLIINNT